ncbi:hypothetical protein BKA82DRAFT_4355507 [Pisolithus tinctorius]|nr:hypothetical protein BKA82DRAFT_4355507 [Pisolithus tinctorius]
MEKCVFIGYPEGYKGWKFYNPTTKCTVISERADFDERYFPLAARPSTPSLSVPIPPKPPSTSFTPLSDNQKPPATDIYHPQRNLDSECESDDDLDQGGDEDLAAGDPDPIPPPIAAPELVPAPPHTPSPSPSLTLGTRPPSPIRIGARLPPRQRQKPREWWKLSPAQLDDVVDEDDSDDELAMSAALPDEPLTYAE